MAEYIANCESGVYCYKRRVFVNRRFEGHEKAQAGVLDVKNGTRLVSYETVVAEVIDGWLHVYGLWGRTTRTHIGWYMREYGLTYGIAKECYDSNVELNVETGEVRGAKEKPIVTVGTCL